jgi:uncharacterized membrane protein YdcZ (DUF606 family)
VQLNKKKNIALVIASAVLFLALFDGWQYGFFTLLRFIVFATTAYVAWMAYEAQREKWVWIFGFIAVLFNPFFLIHLDRDTWVVIDFIVGLFLFVTIFTFKLDKTRINGNALEKR